MDTAYDAIQQEILADNMVDNADVNAASTSTADQSQTLGEEINEAVASFQSTAWGMKIGGFWETVKKQVCDSFVYCFLI